MQTVLVVVGLPSAPLEAAAAFHARWLPEARRRLGELAGEDRALLIALPPADHAHAEWRLAVTRMLAREAAPARVNCVGCDDPDALTKFSEYLAAAPGVTGQYLPTNFQYAVAGGAEPDQRT